MSQPTRLSDVDLAVDGTTQSEIVVNRMARDDLIKRTARRGDPICKASEDMAVLARSMGCWGGTPWGEDLSDDDDGRPY